eukprot:SM000018S03667  [mRNA]  locus=s18:597179:607428:- [translate_table: standard]
MEDAYAKHTSEVLEFFNVEVAQGLSDEQVARLRGIHGKNGVPFWRLILKQFDDLLVKILIVAAIVSFLLAFVNGEGFSSFVEPSVILLILVANAAVGVITESNAEKAIEELKAYQADVATVIRHGKHSSLNKHENCLPGSLPYLGCKIPADLRLVQLLSSQLRVDQAILTGESNSVGKTVEATVSPNAVYQDKTNTLFSGTVVTVGRGRAIVIGIGSKTAIGKIREAMSVSTEEMTPLKRKLDEFGTFLSKVIAVVCVLVWVVNIGHFRDPAHGGLVRGAIYYFKIAVALAVAAIPEGLPAVVTTCLALGTRKMARLNAIVRTLPSVETLGCTTVICSDKTGTLTTNMMSVSKVCVVGVTEPQAVLDEYNVTGTTYAPDGVILKASTNQLQQHPAELPSLLHTAICSALCNDAVVQYNTERNVYEKLGESTEVALRVLAEKVGLPGFDSMPTALTSLSRPERASYCNHHWEQQYTKVATLEFSRDRKMMSVLCTRQGENIVFTKGAPEYVLAACSNVMCNTDGTTVPLTQEVKSMLYSRLYRYGEKEMLRCLALAFKQIPQGQQHVTTQDESELTLIGLVGMLDPPREEVKSAIETCRSAGIRVIVVTGDNKATDKNLMTNITGQATAESVCRRIGVFEADEELSRSSYTASELAELPATQQAVAIRKISLFSRVEPSHKSMLVDALRRQNEVVAMTGDGVNDAPALKKADIGIAMGSGTAVAKGASDMVLADDNFSTIVAAVAEGRAIFNNMKQFIRYMVSSNIGEVVCIFVAAALGMPETLVPVQLLWVNLVTDGLPATALGFNKQDRDVMLVRPRKLDEAIVNGWLFFRYVVVGVYVGLVTVGGFAWWYLFYENGPKMTWFELVSFESCKEGSAPYPCSIFVDRSPSTISMSVLVVVEMFNALNNLSENQSLLVLPPWSNPWLLAAITVSMLLHFLILYVPILALMFSVKPLGWAEWRAVLMLSFPVSLPSTPDSSYIFQKLVGCKVYASVVQLKGLQVILVDEILKFFSRRMRGRSFHFSFPYRTELLPKRQQHTSRLPWTWSWSAEPPAMILAAACAAAKLLAPEDVGGSRDPGNGDCMAKHSVPLWDKAEPAAPPGAVVGAAHLALSVSRASRVVRQGAPARVPYNAAATVVLAVLGFVQVLA